jgi:hypothetical protein
MHTTVPPAVPAAHRQATNTNILVKPLHGQKERPAAASETVSEEKIGKSNRHTRHIIEIKELRRRERLLART